jgi:CPA1 family monovalent cation:H+ antiporter
MTAHRGARGWQSETVGVTEAIALGLLGLAVVLVVHWVSEHTPIPATVLLTVVGGVYAFLPGANISLRPDVVLSAIIPPLLYYAALEASLLDIRRYLRPIVSLSVVLVLVTALAIGALLPVAVGSVGFAAAVALGAAVAPPDPVAALSIGRRVGLPARVTTVIEGEGLLNDATALTIFQVATAAATGSRFSTVFAIGDFLFAAVGGVVVGGLVSWLLWRLLPVREDALIANAVSLATPFACYLVGEELHVSGVLAVVVAGLVAGHRGPRAGTSAGRLQTTAVWRLINFLLEGLVFLMIGQQLPDVIDALPRYSIATLFAAAGATLGVALVLRPLWLLLTQLLPRRIRLSADDGNARPFSVGELTLLSWAGTRGVITLAAAYSLPLGLPQRDLLLFCAFLIVAVTLLGQGLTFAPLARRLGIRASEADGIRARNDARLAAVDAALQRLEEIDDVSPAVRDGLRRSLEERRRRYRHRLDAVEATEGGQLRLSDEYLASVNARRMIIEAERDELVQWRESGRLTEADLRRLQDELDHQESQLPRVR